MLARPATIPAHERRNGFVSDILRELVEEELARRTGGVSDGPDEDAEDDDDADEVRAGGGAASARDEPDPGSVSEPLFDPFLDSVRVRTKSRLSSYATAEPVRATPPPPSPGSGGAGGSGAGGMVLAIRDEGGAGGGRDGRLCGDGHRVASGPGCPLE